MLKKREYQRNLGFWCIIILIIFINNIALGMTLKEYDININFILFIITLLLFPFSFFIFAYYGIRRKTFFLTSHFISHGGLINHSFNRKKLKEETMAKRIGYISLINGIVLLNIVLYAIFKTLNLNFFKFS